MSSSSDKWSKHWLKVAQVISEPSKDPSTKVGAVIIGASNEVLSTGYNGQCRGADDGVPERLERPEKYFHFEHAERNAIYNAARNGIKLEGSTIYCTLLPCMDCARAIVQSGIKKVVTQKLTKELNYNWLDHFQRSKELFRECNVEYEIV